EADADGLSVERALLAARRERERALLRALHQVGRGLGAPDEVALDERAFLREDARGPREARQDQRLVDAHDAELPLLRGDPAEEVELGVEEPRIDSGDVARGAAQVHEAAQGMSLAPVAEQEGADHAPRLDEGPLVDGLPAL